MELRLKKLFTAGVFSIATLTSSMNTSAFVCPINYAVLPIVKPSFQATQTAIDSSIQAMSTTTNASIRKQSDVVTSAIGVLTAQKATAAMQVGKAIEKNSQIVAEAQQALKTDEKIRETKEQFGERSMGDKPCYYMATRQEVHKADINTQRAVNQMVKAEVTARPGRYASRRTALAERLALHDALYCTASQVRSGLCKAVGSREGKSLMAATMFVPSPYDSAEYRDKSALINNMMGLPDDPIGTALAGTYDGVVYGDTKRRKDAIKSTALTSLKYIQAMNSGVDSEHNKVTKALSVAKSETDQLAQAKDTANGKNDAKNIPYSNDAAHGAGTPLVVQLDKDVSHYLGNSQEYKDWSKTLVGQTEKGVLTEIVKIKALRLYIQSKQYEQLSRIEAMLAANVAAETYRNGMEGSIDRQRNQIMRANTAAAIKKSQ